MKYLYLGIAIHSFMVAISIQTQYLVLTFEQQMGYAIMALSLSLLFFCLVGTNNMITIAYISFFLSVLYTIDVYQIGKQGNFKRQRELDRSTLAAIGFSSMTIGIVIMDFASKANLWTK